MFDLQSNAEPDAERNSISPSIFLEYGLDGASGEDASCEICERGMRFKSRWQFTLGTVMSIAFAYPGEGARRFEAEGIVIDCTPAGNQAHLTTFAFLDLPQELRQTLGKVARRLDLPRSRPVCPES